MAVLILIGLLVPPVLAYIGLIGWVPAVVAEFVILFGAAWNFDRQRRPGAPGPKWDAAAPDFAAPLMGDQFGVHEIPTQAVEDPENRTRPARPG
jgi:hypothetical protein